MLRVSVLLLSVLSVWPPAGANTTDPMAEMMALMSEMMSDMDTMADNCSTAADTMLDGIHNESKRIVYTAQLIDGFGTQIGWMADKVVLVEQAMANLTNDCLCNGTSAAVHRPTADPTGDPTGAARNRRHHHHHRPPVRGRLYPPSPPPPAPAPPLAETPWDPLFASMAHALALVAQISSNVTALMDAEVLAIGGMSNSMVLMEEQVNL